MNKDMLSQSSPDRAIYVHEGTEIAYWTKELGVSKEQLLKAVQEAGTSSSDVRRILGVH